MFIQFGIKILSLKNLVIFISPFLLVAKKQWQKKTKNNNKFYIIFLNFLSCTLCGIIHLISKYLSKSKNDVPKRSKLNDFKYKHKKNDKSLRAQLIESIESNEVEKMKRKRRQRIIKFFFYCIIN